MISTAPEEHELLFSATPIKISPGLTDRQSDLGNLWARNPKPVNLKRHVYRRLNYHSYIYIYIRKEKGLIYLDDELKWVMVELRAGWKKR